MIPPCRISPALSKIRTEQQRTICDTTTAVAQAVMRSADFEERYVRQHLTEGFIGQWLYNALTRSLDARLHALAIPDPAKAKVLFDKMLAEAWPEISRQVPGCQPHPGPDRPPYTAIESLLTAKGVSLARRGRGLDDTLSPALKRLDGERSSSSALSKDDFHKVLDVLQFSHNQEEWRSLIPCDEAFALYEQLQTESVNGDPAKEPLRLPLSYPGRHKLASWDGLNRHLEGRPPREITFCEAERLYATGCLAACPPVCVEHHRLLDRACRILGEHRPATLLNDLAPSVHDQWLRAWHNLPGLSDGRQGGAAQPKLDQQHTIASRMVPLPPAGDEGEVAQALLQRFGPAFSDQDAMAIVRAVYTEPDQAAQFPNEVADVMAEAVLLYLTTHWVAPAEALVAASVLARTGLPWLPPAGCQIALHKVPVSVFILLAACGLNPDERLLASRR